MSWNNIIPVERKNMNNPVAWVYPDFFENLEKFHVWYAYKENFNSRIPLYTHPMRELTDEEIGDFTHRMVLCCGVNPNSADINVLGLKFIVEEILKKASEK